MALTRIERRLLRLTLSIAHSEIDSVIVCDFDIKLFQARFLGACGAAVSYVCSSFTHNQLPEALLKTEPRRNPHYLLFITTVEIADGLLPVFGQVLVAPS